MPIPDASSLQIFRWRDKHPDAVLINMNAVTYDEDFYADEFIRNPILICRICAQRGQSCGYPSEYLCRGTPCGSRRGAAAGKAFISGRGISLSDDVNRLLIGSNPQFGYVVRHITVDAQGDGDDTMMPTEHSAA